MPKIVKHFDSSRAYSEWAIREHNSAVSRGQPIEYFSWGSDATDTLDGFRILADGDDTNVPRAQELLHEFQESIETTTFVWEHDIAGAFPDVPQYLAGLPDSMWARHTSASDRTPLRIWVGLSSSAGVTQEQLTKRGCVLSALAIALSNIRPVYITPFVNMGWWDTETYYRGPRGQVSVISWDIRTSPLVLAELLGCTSHPHVTRYAGITACNLLNPATNGHCNPVLTTEANMRALLGAAPADLYIPQIHLYDPMLTNPIQWIKNVLAKYGDEDESDES